MPVQGECTGEAVSVRAFSVAAWTLALWLSLVEREPMATWQKEGLLAGTEATGNKKSE